jgi:hypothetical protein
LRLGIILLDIKVLLGHESIATTQIYTNVGQDRMEKVVARLMRGESGAQGKRPDLPPRVLQAMASVR